MTSETYVIKGGLKITERFFVVPLDYSKPDGHKLRIFARHVVPSKKAKTKDDEEKLPFLVYLQGGPGFEVGLPTNSSYPGEIHEQGYQTLWLDPRGTGLSSPISPGILPDFVKADEEIAEYLSHFRADNIVRDCEHIRQELLGHKEDPKDRTWSILGQSFGGFCAINYLSFFSDGLKEVFITGGLAPLGNDPDQVYQAIIPRLVKRNGKYYEKYPRDIKRVRDILAHLDANEVLLPNKGRLTPRRWQELGIRFGAHGGIDNVHQHVLRAANDLELFGKLTYKTLQFVQEDQSLDGNPIYAILHEAIYCQGRASNWSAARSFEGHSQFSWPHVKVLAETEPVYFIGEMIFPSDFDDYSNLRPWKGAAEILAKKQDWPALYNLDRLSQNKVKVNAVTYFDDMFVDFNLAQDTASKIGNIEQYITNQFYHNGLRYDAKDVIGKLFELSKREVD